MRWFRIRKAKIAPDLRQTLEQHGIGTMQTLLAAPDGLFVYRGQSASANQVRDDLLLWLTEQYDRPERKETWTLTMEAAIIVLIVVEIVLAIMALAGAARAVSRLIPKDALARRNCDAIGALAKQFLEVVRQARAG